KAVATVEVPVPPETLWKLIGGFGSLPDWQPSILKSELTEGGRVRHLDTPKGEAIVERLEAFDDFARSYSYSIVQAPFPVTGYLSTLRVRPSNGGNSSKVEWSGRFTPKGVSGKEASQLFQTIFEDGLKALAARFVTKERKSA